MNYAKILQDLRARADRTEFVNEREICLKKIADIVATKIIDNQEITDNLTVSIPIEVLRDLFVEQIFPLYKYEIEEGYVPFLFDPSTITWIEDKIRVVSSDLHSDKFLKYLDGIKNWARNQKDIFYSYPRDIQSMMYQNNYIEVSPEFIYWMSPLTDKVGWYDENDKYQQLKYTKENVVKVENLKFEKQMKRFMGELNRGYHDAEIKDFFNPTRIEA